MSLYDLAVRKTKDTAGDLEADDFHGNVAEALKRYSKVRPLTKCADIEGSGVNDYDLPEGWISGFSGVQAVEYPIGDVPETYLCKNDYKLYQTPDGQKLRIISVKPPVGASFRVTFTGRQTEETLPETDIEAVANLAASLCCRQLAQRYAGTSDPTISADTVNYRSKGDEFARRAKDLEKLYRDALGIREEDTVPAAMATAGPPDTDRQRLTHRSR